jgi:hypothetical protein
LRLSREKSGFKILPFERNLHRYTGDTLLTQQGEMKRAMETWEREKAGLLHVCIGTTNIFCYKLNPVYRSSKAPGFNH